jgi:integrase
MPAAPTYALSGAAALYVGEARPGRLIGDGPALGIERRADETARAFGARLRDEVQASSRAIRPHDCRHSWVTHLRAAGIDDADLAAVAGHAVDTMLGTYTHPLSRSHDRIRDVIG